MHAYNMFLDIAIKYSVALPFFFVLIVIEMVVCNVEENYISCQPLWPHQVRAAVVLVIGPVYHKLKP